MTVDMGVPDLHSWMREVERRLRVAETASRVPSLGNVGGQTLTTPQSKTLTESYSAISGGASVQSTVTQRGQLLVWLTAVVSLEGSFPAGALTSVALAGPTPVAAADAWSVFRFAGTEAQSTTAFHLFEGLAPGVYTVQMQARHTGVAPSVSTWTRRGLAAFPL